MIHEGLLPRQRGERSWNRGGNRPVHPNLALAKGLLAGWAREETSAQLDRGPWKQAEERSSSGLKTQTSDLISWATTRICSDVSSGNMGRERNSWAHCSATGKAPRPKPRER